MKTPFWLSASFVLASAGAGYGANEGDEPTKYQSQAGLEKLTRQAGSMSKEAVKKSSAGAGSSSINPGFLVERNTNPGTAISQDIDRIIRPVLVKLFQDAKLISAAGPEAPKIDGEVVEDRLIYSVKQLLTEGGGDSLHSALRAAGFTASPRLGSKPSHGRKNVVMSLFQSTSLRGYSFVINVDMAKQRIEVESYRLGSKYDRLM